MSRSYRKPVVKNNQSIWKAFFNRRIRRLKPLVVKSDNSVIIVDPKPISNGNHYRKMNESWLIHDYRFYIPHEPSAYRK